MLLWFSIGCLFYVVMMAVLHGKVANGTVHNESDETQELFFHLERLTLATWSFYPVVVFLGRAQLKIISKSTEDTMLCILDCLAKLGMEGLIVAWAVFIWDDSSSSVETL
jgi:bacteriorhodopsin